jgi:hypothetical protein
MLALAGLLAATVMVSGVAVAGLGAVDARTQELYHHNILTTQAIAELQATLDDAGASALQLLLFEKAGDRSRLLADLQGRIVPPARSWPPSTRSRPWSQRWRPPRWRYAAKGNGRNRVELFISPDRGQDAPASKTGLRAK